MSITVELTRDEEVRLAAHARARHTTPEKLVREILEPILAVPAGGPLPGRRLDLPAMKGVVIGTLRRCDIYDERG
jgi:hypothetical protein